MLPKNARTPSAEGGPAGEIVRSSCASLACGEETGGHTAALGSEMDVILRPRIISAKPCHGVQHSRLAAFVTQVVVVSVE